MRLSIALCLASPAATAAAQAQEIDGRMCQGRESCTLIATHEAGTDEDGNSLAVVELGFDAEDSSVVDAAEWACRFDPDGFEGGREYWLSADEGIAPERILTVCNDGYGASMVGEDAISFADNRIVMERYGGSAWRWVETATLRLRPQRLLSRYSCSTYGAWTRSVRATDWTRGVTWYAWSPEFSEIETAWCPPLDPSLSQPAMVEPYLLGVMIPGYEIAELAAGETEIEGLGSCALGVAGSGSLSVPNDQSNADLRLVAFLEPEKLTLRLMVSLGRELAAEAGSLRLDVVRAEYEALDWLSGDRSEPSPYQMHEFLLPAPPDGETSGVWTLRPEESGPDETLISLQRASAADLLEVNLLGVAVSVMADDGSDAPLATTVAWRDGAPSHTPPIAWRPIANGWPTCRLDDNGELTLEGVVTENPMDYY